MSTVPELMKFLSKQRESSNLKDQFTPLEVFDSITPVIREHYDACLASEEKDDFDEDISLENIVSGVPLLVGMFFDRVFLPHCIYYMYTSIISHCTAYPEILFKELFSIGAGSATDNLSPEITALCDKCVEERFPFLFIQDSEQLRRINIEFFKCQQRDKFLLRLGSEVEDSESERGNNFSNPFGSESDSCDKSDTIGDLTFDGDSLDKTREYICKTCSQVFPNSEFLAIHSTVFHTVQFSSHDFGAVSVSEYLSVSDTGNRTKMEEEPTKKTVRATFVGNVDSMITSFHKLVTPDKKENPVSSRPAIGQKHKYIALNKDKRKVKYNLRTKF